LGTASSTTTETLGRARRAQTLPNVEIHQIVRRKLLRLPRL
jgi:hypothetical protein